jgi:hypothetical protein
MIQVVELMSLTALVDRFQVITKAELSSSIDYENQSIHEHPKDPHHPSLLPITNTTFQ